MAALAEATMAFATTPTDDADGAVELAGHAVELGVGARWEVSVRAAHAVVLGRAGRRNEAGETLDGLISLARDDGKSFMTFDAVAAVAALEALGGDGAAARAAVGHASITRTPLATALLLEAGAAVGTEPGIEQFVGVFDPTAFAARAERAETFLASVR